MRAWSLNYRDLSMPRGGYLNNDKVRTDPPLVPLSDGAGEVLAVGEGVQTVQVGDRVASCFFQDWTDGDIDAARMRTALGGAIDGVLAERVVLAEQGVVRFPGHLDDAEAATLPCAAVTAWEALTRAGLAAGDTILTLGTGGVSIFALQLAKASGARVIITSSSSAKLARARALGADETVNYQEHPDWDEVVREWTAGRGVDHVVELGGAGTLERSLRAARVSGTVSLIGVLTGAAENPSPMLALFHRLTIRGIYVGSRAVFEDLNRLISEAGIRPVIDRRFGFDAVREAYTYLRSAKHFGKVVITR
jgi:NADPH:quinone reductase-like Zn-dependent oxidoreductase